MFLPFPANDALFPAFLFVKIYTSESVYKSFSNFHDLASSLNSEH